MYMCVRSINFTSFYNFLIGFWNCSDSVKFLVFLVVDFVYMSLMLVLLPLKNKYCNLTSRRKINTVTWLLEKIIIFTSPYTWYRAFSIFLKSSSLTLKLSLYWRMFPIVSSSSEFFKKNVYAAHAASVYLSNWK